MIKRKLFFVAVLLAMLCFCLLKIGGISFFNEMPEKNAYVTITGKIDQIENKNSSKYIYLKNTKNKDLDSKYGNIILSADKDICEKQNLKLGSNVEVYCKYIGFNISRNAGNYDEYNYYHSLGISGKFRLESGKYIQVTDNKWNYIKQWLYEIKTRISEVFDSIMTGYQEKSGIFSAIVAGDKSGLDQDVKELYQNNGIAHILAISGLHISLIGMSIYNILRKRHSFFGSCLISSILMVGFCIMSGESVSAVRATIMFLVRMLAEVTGKTFDMLSALALSAVLVIVSNPHIILNGAFLLSFSAILGVGIINKIIEAYYSSKKRMIAAFTVSLSVSLATLPVITSIYYEIPLYSVFLNLLIVPLMSFILGSGIICGFTGILSITLGRFVIGAGVYLLSFVEILCTLIDRIPYSIIITGKPDLWKIVLFYLVLAAGLLFMKKKSKSRSWKSDEKKDSHIPVKKLFFVLLWAILLFFILIIKIPPSKLSLHFFDVGQGDGYLIQSPSGLNYLIDGGSTSVSGLKEYRLESAIKYLGVSVIDYSFVTHTDTDHISGVIDLIKDTEAGHITIKNLVVPDIEGNEMREELIQLAEERGIHVIKFQTGDIIEDRSLKFTCLHPEKNYGAKDNNGKSLVILLEFDDFKALLTGDIGTEEEKLILKKNIGRVSLLKVAHHGSRYSSSPEFLDSVFDGSGEKTAIISAGINNSYGHPHKETIDRLKVVGAKVFCTADFGEISIYADKNGNINVEKYLLNF